MQRVGYHTRQYNALAQGDTMPQYKAVNGSAKQNLPNSFMKLELNIMHGERRGLHVIQHNTRREAIMNNIGMERRRMLKELDNQSSCQATAKIARKTAAAASTFQRGQCQ